MSDEILRRLDELKAGQSQISRRLTDIETRLIGLEGIEPRLVGLESKVDANHQILVDVQRSTNDSFEILLSRLPGPGPRAVRTSAG